MIENTTISLDNDFLQFVERSNASVEYLLGIEKYTQTYTIDDFYVNVGAPKLGQGWLLHITVIPSEIQSLLEVAIPILFKYNCAFKLIKNKTLHRDLNAGMYGRYKIGKVVTIYLDNEGVIENIISELLTVTDRFTGPQILTDFYIGSILYVRYGSFVTQIEADQLGNHVRVIKDANGNPFLDQYYTPPIVPDGFKNPFLKWAQQTTNKNEKKLFLINNKYLPVRLLKSDSKGDVWRGLYFKWNFLPKWCIIKQGRKGMFADTYGRDACSRLEWQYKNSEILANSIPLPEVIEFISQKNQSFLILENIRNAKDLSSLIPKYLKNINWKFAPQKSKFKVVDIFIKISLYLVKMHEKGIVHRDVTATNILVSGQNKINFIDLELSYSTFDKYPQPPFGIGTPGFMSPEQTIGNDFPTTDEDIYTFGALMAMILSGGIQPINFLNKPQKDINTALQIIFQNDDIVPLLIKCVSYLPEDRPDAQFVYQTLVDYRSSIHNIPQGKSTFIYPSIDFSSLIVDGINTLNGSLLSHNNQWYSRVDNLYGMDVYPLVTKHFYGTLYRGVGGILYFLSKAKECGFDITHLSSKIDAALTVIQANLIDKVDNISSSFYYGKAGLALILRECMNAEIIEKKEDTISFLTQCFPGASDETNLYFGCAGQGMAALYCSDVFSEQQIYSICDNYTSRILSSQQSDGSWVWQENNYTKPQKRTGFGYGMAGVILFLLSYYKIRKEPKILASITKGLSYLRKVALKKNNNYYWNVSQDNKESSRWLCRGSAGIAYVFLLAYKTLNNSKYLEIAKKALHGIPNQLAENKFTQCHGLSGLGEVYLEAFSITGDPEWHERAKWIAHYLYCTRTIDESKNIFWLSDDYDFPTGDFMVGNSGILHFLLRYYNPNKLNFPFLFRNTI